MVTVERVVVGLRNAGFNVVEDRRATVVLHRLVGRRDDHVRIETGRAGWWQLGGQGRTMQAVKVGQVWRLVEQAFNRPVPRAPDIPAGVHVGADLTRATMVRDDGPTVGASDHDRISEVVVGWCDRMGVTADVLAAGLPDDPVLRLEFAVVARDRAAGLAAARTARVSLDAVRPAERRHLRRHIDVAVGRLP